MYDLRFACRQLLKNPAFTAVAVLSLALGIAANTTIFSFVNALLLRPPPVERPDQLWQVWQLRPKASSDLKRFGNWGPAEIAYLREHNRSFAALGAFETEPNFTSWNRNGVGEPALPCQETTSTSVASRRRRVAFSCLRRTRPPARIRWW